MAPALHTEDIARAVVAHIDATLRTHLDAVEARWAAVDPMALPSPVDVTFGFEEIVLRMATTDFSTWPHAEAYFPARPLSPSTCLRRAASSLRLAPRTAGS